MAKWKIIVSIVLAAVSIMMAAAQSWLAGLVMLLIASVVVVFYMFTLKKGGNILVKIGFIIIECYFVFGTVFDVYAMISCVPDSITLSGWVCVELILLILSTIVQRIQIILASVFPFIYCITRKRETKEKSVG